MDVPIPLPAAEPIPEQDAGVRISGSHSGDNGDVTMGLEE